MYLSIMRRSALALVAAFLLSPAHAQTVSAAKSYPVGELQVPTAASVAAKRASIIATISGTSVIAPPAMSSFDGACCGASAAAYFGVTPATTMWQGWNWHFGGGSIGMVARTYFATFTGSTCLFVYNGGHGEGFFTPAVADPSNAPMAETQAYVRRIVNTLGCDVILSSMPLSGENYSFQPYVGYPWPNSLPLHDYLGTLAVHAPPIGTPLRYFLEPAYGAISYALSLRSYSKVIVSGLSGGGWTTTLLAAIDPRITNSYAVAGSVPFPYRAASEGDWEQRDGMAPLNVDYSDLYLMGTVDAAGNPTRRVGLLHNGADACCFKGVAVNGYALWLKMKAVEGGFGALRIFIDPDKIPHAVHTSHVDAILNDITTH